MLQAHLPSCLRQLWVTICDRETAARAPNNVAAVKANHNGHVIENPALPPSVKVRLTSRREVVGRFKHHISRMFGLVIQIRAQV